MELLEGWHKSITTSNQRLTRVAWASSDMVSNIIKFGDVIVIDTTQKKNCFNMPLILCVVMDSDGKLRVAGAALVSSEDNASFHWFCTFLIRLGWTPKVVFSDGDVAISSTLAIIKGCVHYLCIWHIIKNLRKNCLNALGDQKNEFIGDFRVLPNIQSKLKFVEEWNAFLKKYSVKEQYLVEVLGGGNLQKWPRCFLNDHFTLNITASSYVESMNAKLSRVLTSKSPLATIINEVSKLDVPANFNKSKSWKESAVTWKSAEVTRMNGIYPLEMISNLQKCLLQHAVGLIIAQMQLGCSAYRRVDQMEDGSTHVLDDEDEDLADIMF